MDCQPFFWHCGLRVVPSAPHQQRLGHGATFGDYGGHGRLDFFVAGYLRFDINHPPATGIAAVNFTTCEYHKLPVMCGPRGLPGERDRLFLNNGDGTFTDVSKKLGSPTKTVSTASTLCSSTSTTTPIPTCWL